MAITAIPSTTQVRPETSRSTTPDGFELDVTLVEVADPAGLTNLTDDGCGSTCGACTTGVA
ncbi:FxLD family lanthipeptide [Streptomyces laurentii]|uniref:FxLD family lanthipeptide n=1 Tax=Streptomyces laurentii TaxID=39478 RepID=UPI0033EF5358